MSAYSTLRITIRKALSVYLYDRVNFESLEELIETNSPEELFIEIPNKQELEDFMDNYLESRLYNCILVSSNDENNQDYMI